MILYSAWRIMTAWMISRGSGVMSTSRQASMPAGRGLVVVVKNPGTMADSACVARSTRRIAGSSGSYADGHSSSSRPALKMAATVATTRRAATRRTSTWAPASRTSVTLSSAPASGCFNEPTALAATNTASTPRGASVRPVRQFRRASDARSNARTAATAMSWRAATFCPARTAPGSAASATPRVTRSAARGSSGGVL